MNAGESLRDQEARKASSVAESRRRGHGKRNVAVERRKARRSASWIGNPVR
jgi:hypothetical protein